MRWQWVKPSVAFFFLKFLSSVTDRPTLHLLVELNIVIRQEKEVADALCIHFYVLLACSGNRTMCSVEKRKLSSAEAPDEQ